MAEFDGLQNPQNSSAQRMNNGSTEITAGVPPPPAYSAHNAFTAAANTAGLLRTKISLGGRKPTVIMPFLLMKPELPAPSPINGNMNLLTYYGLDHAWNKFCAPNKKLKEELSAFLPHLPGNVDMPGNQDNSSLRSLIDKPPITGKEIMPLSTGALSGFKLQPGPIPESYRVFSGAFGPSRPSTSAENVDEKPGRLGRKKHKRKHERSSHRSEENPAAGTSKDEKQSGFGSTSTAASITAGNEAGPERHAAASGSTGEEWKKVKSEDGGGGTSEKKKKKKKDKKRKRSRSPDHSTSSAAAGAPPSHPSVTSAYNASSFVDF